MDEVDQKIISQLQLNGRTTFEELAKLVMKADEPIKNIRLAKKWVITLFPTQGFADLEGMSLEEYTDTIVKASIVDPKLLEEVEEDIAKDLPPLQDGFFWASISLALFSTVSVMRLPAIRRAISRTRSSCVSFLTDVKVLLSMTFLSIR